MSVLFSRLRLQHRLAVLGCCLGALSWFVSPGGAAGYNDKRERTTAVLFHPVGGVSVTNVTVSLTAESRGGVIRYTLDGSEPGPGALLYSSPLHLTNTTLVRAMAFPKDAAPGPIGAEIYTVVEEDLTNFTSNLPLVIVNSFGTNITREQKLDGALQVMDGRKGRTSLTEPATFSGRVLINMRGRASLRYPKNSFTVKTIDGSGDPRPAQLLGLPADSDWVLYAPYPDKTLMRDVLAYELHREMGHWAPRARFIEVFLNQTGTRLSRRDYVGVYVLEEKIKRGKERVDIAKLTPEDETAPRITGGYIFKKDHIDQGMGPVGGEGGGYGMGGVSTSTRAGFPTGPGGFPADPKGFQPAARTTRSSSSSSSVRSSRAARVVTNHLGFASTLAGSDVIRSGLVGDDFDGLSKNEQSFKTGRTNEFYFVEPEPDEITAVQKAWLKNHLRQFEAALYGPDFQDPRQGYGAYVDIGSFIDYQLIAEMTKNVDAFRFSVFYHKDRGGKIKADPVWDWNLSFGNANGKQGWLPEFWLWPQLDDKEYSWYRRLFEDPDFGQQYVDRWAQLRAKVFATEKILARVDELATLLNESQQRNFEKWPILGRSINPNYFVGSTYEEEVAWMKKFIQTRLAWMEKQFPPVPKLTVPAGAGSKAALAAPAGEIYFTLDGSDPRAPGGEVSKTALLYRDPMALEAGAKVFARVRQDNRWSGPLLAP